MGDERTRKNGECKAPTLEEPGGDQQTQRAKAVIVRRFYAAAVLRTIVADTAGRHCRLPTVPGYGSDVCNSIYTEGYSLSVSTVGARLFSHTRFDLQYTYTQASLTWRIYDNALS